MVLRDTSSLGCSNYIYTRVLTRRSLSRQGLLQRLWSVLVGGRQEQCVARRSVDNWPRYLSDIVRTGWPQGVGECLLVFFKESIPRKQTVRWLRCWERLRDKLWCGCGETAVQYAMIAQFRGQLAWKNTGNLTPRPDPWGLAVVWEGKPWETGKNLGPY